VAIAVPHLKPIVAPPRWAKDGLWRKAQLVPSLDLNFAATKNLVDATTGASLVTFTRASSATYVDSQGVIQTASTDVPRFDHNPVTGESLGLLVEEQRQNLFTYSDQFDNAAWAKTVSTVTANATTAPDGNTTADLLITDNGSNNGLVQQTISKAASPVTYTFSCYGKAENLSSLRLILRDPANSANRADLILNLITGATSGSFVGGTYSSLTSSAAPLTNGWWRFSITATTGSEVSTVGQIISNGAGDGTSGIYLWGAQLEVGSFPTSYIPTTTAAATRAADVASITGTNFSSWYRQDEGTFYTQQRTDATNSIQGAYMVQAGTQQGRGIAASIDTRDVEQRLATSIRDDVSFGRASIAGLVDNDLQSIGHSWSDGATTAALNGITGTGTYNAIYPGLDTLHIGYNVISVGGPTYLGGRIKRLTFWPQRFDASVLQAITQ
jgi:hypothetical protein